MTQDIDKNNQTRCRRANLWLRHAESEKGGGAVGKTTQFIFYWIAFDAAYGKSNDSSGSALEKFIDNVVAGKEQEFIELFDKKRMSMNKIIDLPQTHKNFWTTKGMSKDNPKGKRYAEWVVGFKRERRQIKEGYITEASIAGILLVVFKRLLTVRNQIMHGASSGNESIGTQQVEEGVEILAAFIPKFIEVMKEKMRQNTPPKNMWGNVSYPRVSDDDAKNLRPTWHKK